MMVLVWLLKGSAEAAEGWVYHSVTSLTQMNPESEPVCAPRATPLPTPALWTGQVRTLPACTHSGGSMQPCASTVLGQEGVRARDTHPQGWALGGPRWGLRLTLLGNSPFLSPLKIGTHT